MKFVNSVVDLVGETPLVKLNRVTDGVQATVLAKVEYFNPGGSVKDRIAVRIIDAAEASGELKPGGTIIEPTSGNTGVGLALVAQQRGYHCIFVVPDKVAEDKRSVLRAYGAEVVVAPTSVSPEDPQSYYSVSDRLTAEIPGAYKPNQFFNASGPLSHYSSTGPEIWRDTEGKVTHFVAGVGTGGTISGTAKYLREASHGSIRIIGADPDGSIYSGGAGRPYQVEGVGEDMWPGAYDQTLVDEVLAVTDAESFVMTKRLAREEGLLVGGSSGMAVVAALRVAARLGPEDVVVVLLPDGGRGYLGKIFNDEWMSDHGYKSDSLAEGDTVADILRSVDPEFVSGTAIAKEIPIGEVIEQMITRGLTHVSVTEAGLPCRLGELIGVVTISDLITGISSGGVNLNDPLSDAVGDHWPKIGIYAALRDAELALHNHEAVIVLDGGNVVGLLTRPMLLTFAAKRSKSPRTNEGHPQ